MSVIAIDSASRTQAWVILSTEDGAVVAQRELPGGELDRALPGGLAALLTRDVTAAVVLTGPGSYSGVRAGMAAALGLASALGIPLHGLGNLTALAAVADVADGVEFSVASDAGRGGMYLARFTRRGSLVEQVTPLRRVTIEDVATAGRVFATAEVEGLRTEQVDPVRVLAAAVPRALALPPLVALGLRAVHPGATDNGAPTAGGGTREGL